jgi:GDP-4-dehydro-6-deoxy-D-mannose reductase
VTDPVRSSPVLVTGATGFAGGYLVEQLAAVPDLVAWGRSAPPAALRGLATWHRVDLLDRDAVREAIAALRPATVYHLAGASQVAGSWVDTTAPLAGNVLATSHLLDAIRREGLACRVLVTGSATVYAPSDEPIAEGATLRPSGPYALSKFAQEMLALQAYRDDGVNVILVRPFNHTGPRQQPTFVAPSMARQIALIERGLLDPVIRVGNLDSRRDFTDVRDVVSAYVALMSHGRPGECYNVGSGVGRPIRAVLDALLARSRTAIRVDIDPARLRPAESEAFVADCTRLHATTGWRPSISFDQMLDDLLRYWRSRATERESRG